MDVPLIITMMCDGDTRAVCPNSPYMYTVAELIEIYEEGE